MKWLDNFLFGNPLLRIVPPPIVVETPKTPPDSKYELTLLKIRNLVAEQEMNRSSADRENALGGWLYDHGSEHIRLQLEIDRLFSDLTATQKEGGGA